MRDLKWYRLNVENPSNLDLFNRVLTELVEDNQIEMDIGKSIHVMNAAFLIVICFMVKIFYMYFLIDDEDKMISGDMLRLSGSFIAMFSVPIFIVLNDIVRVQTMIKDGVKDKLDMLALK